MPEGLLVAATVEAALTWGAEIAAEVFVAGGAQVYAAALPFSDRLLITWVEASPDGDTFFPDVDWTQWAETSREPHEGWTLTAYERLGGRPGEPTVPA